MIALMLSVGIYSGNLISVSSADGRGKRIVNIHSFSGQTNGDDSPYNLLVGETLNLGTPTKRWCENQNSHPWVIFTLTDYYLIDKIVFRDAKTAEPNSLNTSEYWIYVSTTGTADADWIEVLHRTGVGAENVKTESFTPTEARYVKFVTTQADGAARIYGFDIYGTYSRPIERGDIVSVGKTIIDFHSCASFRETPANAFDGYNAGSNSDGWNFNKDQGDGWIKIDLESAYDIYKFVLQDSQDWLNGYKVYVSNTGDDTDWQLVANNTYPDVQEIKEASLTTPVRARFVKLEIPASNQNNWTRIRAFDVLGTLSTEVTSVQEALSKTLKIYPNPVEKGNDIQINETGIISIYSLQGILLKELNIENQTSISTNNLCTGNYIIQINNQNGTKQFKLTVN